MLINIGNDLIGEKFTNNANQEYEILYISRIKPNKNKIYRIRFTATGYERDIEKVEIKRGKIKDKLAPSVCGIGILGEVKMVDHKREYSIWSGMFERCYDTNCWAYSSYGGKGVIVCDRWHLFTNFLEDLPMLDGYDYELFQNGTLHLDKDIKQQHKSPNDKIYAPEFCSLVTFEENNLYRNNEHRKHRFKAISPEGIVEEWLGLKAFCRQHLNLNRKSITDCLKGKMQNYKGWKFEYIV